jgi:hypothetical protein
MKLLIHLMVFIGLCLMHVSYALNYEFPPPEQLITDVDLVAVGVLVQVNDQWALRINKVIKGKRKDGDLVNFVPDINNHIVGAVGQNPFMFVGWESKSENGIDPGPYAFSAWPYGLPEYYRPAKTVEECVKFAEAALAKKLKPRVYDEGPMVAPSARPAPQPKAKAAAAPSMFPLPEELKASLQKSDGRQPYKREPPVLNPVVHYPPKPVLALENQKQPNTQPAPRAISYWLWIGAALLILGLSFKLLKKI